MTMTTCKPSVVTKVLNERGEIAMNRKGIIIATKVLFIYNWLLGYVSECAGNSYAIIQTETQKRFYELIEKPEIGMIFIEKDFFDDKLFGVLDKLKKKFPKVRIIVFSSSEIPDRAVANYLNWGADSYLNLRDEPDDVSKQCAKLIKGKMEVSKNVWRYIIANNRIPEKPPHLTFREIEVVRSKAQEKRNKDISVSMGISKSTLNNHIRNIYDKFDIHSPVGLLRLALTNGILSLDEVIADDLLIR